MTTDLVKFDEKTHNGVAIDFALMQASSKECPLYSIDDICSFWSISREFFDALKQDAEFIRTVRSHMLELKKSGDHLSHKARLLMEHFMDHDAYRILHDQEVSVSDKDKLLNTLLKVSGMVEKNKAVNGLPQEGGQVNTGPVLNLVLQTSQPMTIEKVVN